MTERPTKITFAEMRDMGVRGLLVVANVDTKAMAIAAERAISGGGRAIG